MGSKKIAHVDMTEAEDKKSSTRPNYPGSKTGKLGGSKNVSKMSSKDKPSVTSNDFSDSVIKKASKAQEDNQPTTKPVSKPSRQRSKRYTSARAQVDKTKTYSPAQAISLVKKLSSKKHPTITADINLNVKDSFEVAFPHQTGKTLRVAIATPTLLKKIQDNKIDFDILLAKPDQMKDIARLAKILGPKGLMPNPKNRTIVSDPQKRKKELEGGKTNIKCEPKAPIIHCQIASTQMTDKQIEDNLSALIKTITPAKISRLTLSSTMSPGVKIDIQQSSNQAT